MGVGGKSSVIKGRDGQPDRLMRGTQPLSRGGLPDVKTHFLGGSPFPSQRLNLRSLKKREESEMEQGGSPSSTGEGASLYIIFVQGEVA